MSDLLSNSVNAVVRLAKEGGENILRGVKTGEKDNDAVNVKQLNDAIGGVELTDVTHSELLQLATDGGITPGLRYRITDRGGEGIIVTGATATTVTRQGTILALNADYQHTGDYSGITPVGNKIGVWRKSTQAINYSITVGTAFNFDEVVSNGTGASGHVGRDDGGQIYITAIIGSFADGDHITGADSHTEADVSGDGEDIFRPAIHDIVIWNNTHYQNKTGNNSSVSPDSDGTNWESISQDITTGYIRAADPIIYDFENDAVITRWDKNKNQVTAGVGSFPWGNDNFTNCLIVGYNNFLYNTLTEAVITDFISINGGVGMIGFNGSITDFIARECTIDFTNAWMIIQSFYATGSFVNMKNQFIGLNNVRLDVGNLTGNFANPGKPFASLTTVSITSGAQVQIGKNMAGFISQSSFSNNCVLLAPIVQGYYLTQMEISVPVQFTLDGTGQHTGLTARYGYSNIEATVVPNGVLIVTYDNHTGPAFANLSIVQNDVTGATATIYKHSATILALFNVSGEWNDNDHFHSQASAAAADTNGQPENSAAITYNTLAGGPFTIGESLTDGTTGATGEVTFDDGASHIYVKHVTGLFKNTDTITGGASGATAKVNGDPSYLTLDLQNFAYAGIIHVSPETSQEFIDTILNAQSYFPYRLYPSSGKLITLLSSSNIHNINGDSFAYTGDDGDWIEYAPGNTPWENTHAIY